MLCSPAAQGMGFAALHLRSALGEPLRAHIALLSVSPAERASLTVYLADEQQYRHFGLARDSMVSAIDINRAPTQDTPDRVLFNLSSRQAMKTPLLELLVVAQTQRGELVRQYTVFLDPAQRGAGGVRRSGGSNYGPVKPGETLWNIASAFKYADVSIHQMLVAIYRHNPTAFAGRINRLRVGSELAIPTAASVRAIDAAAARTQIASARQQRLNRLVAAVDGRSPSANGLSHGRVAVAATTQSGTSGQQLNPQPGRHGRLRLVAPRNFARTDSRSILTAAVAKEPVDSKAVGDSKVAGSTFGVLALPIHFASEVHRAPQRSNTMQLVSTEIKAKPKAESATTGFGQLAAAPATFPPSKPLVPAVADEASRTVQPVNTALVNEAVATTADVSPPPVNAAPVQAEPEPARQANLLSLRMVLWLVVVLCLLLAAALWLQNRYHRSGSAALASVGPADAGVEPESRIAHESGAS